MPTPVSTARQCLTDEAARALDDAVAVAVRRSHAQTTSLHAVSALLALPSSTLREACARARSSEYSPLLQFRALELCVSVSLDRLQSSKSGDEPPVANSLMAAIKRSQANQRRQPETFHLYQQMQFQNPSALTCVKVELKHFILSILDDPSVSRVFEEAGFRGSDIKLAILHPPPISRFSPSRVPPLFLSTLSNSDPNHTRFNFPFAEFRSGENVDENSKRIGEILAKNTTKNPILIGVWAIDALSNFTESVNRGKSVLPVQIEKLCVISIADAIHEVVGNGGSKEKIDLKLKEISEKTESCSDGGVVVNYGELKVFVDGGSVDPVNYVVSKLSNLVALNAGKLWLIGAATSDDTYKKFLIRFPSIEKDWDLCVLPITSSTKPSNVGSFSKSSLMGSFVPFGGFFPTPSELQSPLTSTSKSATWCQQCNEKYEHEASLILKGSPPVSVAANHSTNLPFWLHKDDSINSKKTDAIEIQSLDSNNLTNTAVASDGGTVLNARITGLQRKWNDICQRLHQTRPLQQIIPHDRSHSIGFQFGPNIKQNGIISPNSCITSVATDLGLGSIYGSSQENPRKPDFQDLEERLRSSSKPTNQSFMVPFCGNEKDFKYLFRILAEKVEWQDEAISAICETVSRCRSGRGRRRGDIWLGFLGPDRMGKKRIAEELSVILFGNREKFISVDLSSEEDGVSSLDSAFCSQGLDSNDARFRGKTVVDYIADELRKKPDSVIFLENIDKADFVSQNCLSRAIKTGKFQDSHTREIGTNNTIFITTSSVSEVDKKIQSKYTEERIIEAKCMDMQIIVERLNGDCFLKTNSSNVFVTRLKGNKRKLIESHDSIEKEVLPEKPKRTCLDLNLPVDENDGDCDSSSENTVSFFHEFLDHVEEKVFFKQFDFDSRADIILKKIELNLKKSGLDVLLEIDEDSMVQILAADWILGCTNEVENWIENVLCKGFVEAKQKQGLIGDFMFKLVPLESQERDSRMCVCLPSRINIK